MKVFDSALLSSIGATQFFARELERVKAQTYDIKYPQLSFANGRVIPIDTSAGPGAETITYRQYDMTGIAKIVANYADDLPLVNVAGKEFTSKVKSLGDAYTYSLQDVRAAQMAGRPLSDRLAMSARRAIEQKINQLAVRGDEEHNILGLLNNPNIPDFEVANDGTGTSRLWSTKTAAQILRDMNRMETEIVNATFGVERPNTLLLPIAQYQQIATTRNSDSSDLTILEFFLAKSIGIRNVEPVLELKEASADGDDLMIAYNNSPEYLTLEIPQPFEQLPVQEKNLSFTVPCHSRFGGVIVYYPLSIVIGEGI